MPQLIKKFSTTFIALVVLIIIGSYYFFFEKGQPDPEKVKSQIFTGIYKEQITSLKLIYPDASIVISKENEDWYLARDGKRFKADKFTVETIVDNFADLSSDTVISETDDNLSEYGITSPRVEVILGADSGEYSMKVGTDSPVGSGIYVKTANKAGVMLVEAGQVWPFLDRVFNDLRDKEIINLNEDNITQVEFVAGNFNQAFSKQDGKWQSPGLADYIVLNQLQIEGIVRSFTDLRVVGFETDEPESLSLYGLEKPSAVLKLTEGDRVVEYIFGDSKSDTDRYMKLSTRDSVYLVSSHNFGQLPMSIDDLRIKRISSYDSDAIKFLTIQNGWISIRLTMKDKKWGIEGVKDDLDQVKINDLVTLIADLKAAEFADDVPKDLTEYGLASPVITIVMNEDAPSALLFGKQKGEEVYVKTADKNSIYLVSNQILTAIPKTVDDIKLDMRTDEGTALSNLN